MRRRSVVSLIFLLLQLRLGLSGERNVDDVNSITQSLIADAQPPSEPPPPPPPGPAGVTEEGSWEPNFCDNDQLMAEAGLTRTVLGQFIGFDCSPDFFHCRKQGGGYRTYKKVCGHGLVYDTTGTQNCNYDFNVKGCGFADKYNGELAVTLRAASASLHFDRLQQYARRENLSVLSQKPAFLSANGLIACILRTVFDEKL